MLVRAWSACAQDDKASLRDSTRAVRAQEGGADEAAKPLNPAYACDAAVVRITRNFSFVFGPCAIHPFIAVSLDDPPSADVD